MLKVVVMKNTLSFLVVVCILFFTGCEEKTDQQKTSATVDQQTIKDHIYYLASDEMKGRAIGSPEIQEAAQYLADKLKEYGAEPVSGLEGFFQPVPLRKTVPPSVGTLSMGNSRLKHGEEVFFLDGQDANLFGDAVYLNYGLEADYGDINVTDKLIFVQAGDGESVSTRVWLETGRLKKKLALERGAKGLIEFYNAPGAPWKQTIQRLSRPQVIIDEEGHSDDALGTIPHIWINDADNNFRKQVASGAIKSGVIGVSGMVNSLLPSKNIIAYIEGTDPELKDEFVMFSAHYDHVGIGRPDADGDSIYNGARDNAIGVATVLSAAENIGKYPLKRSALFVLFTAEESGLLGSKWLADHPVIANKDIVFCFNSDNGGYNDTTISTIVGLTRTTAQPLIKEAVAAFGLEAIEDPTGVEQGLFDRSDNVSFAKKGIPAPTFSLGFRAFDSEIGKYYHQPADSPESLDYEYLFKFFNGYVLASRLIGNAAERPFWVEGDKYYETGKSLYGN